MLSFHDLPLEELQAARLDGEVFAIDECFSPIDSVEQRSHRAQALATLMQPRLIAERRTAAWVHGALARPPAVHEFCASVNARARPSISARAVVREVTIHDEEVLTLGGVHVTTPLRTALDLLRVSETFGPAEEGMVLALFEIGHVSLDDCRAAAIERHKLPGKVRALRRLAAFER